MLFSEHAKIKVICLFFLCGKTHWKHHFSSTNIYNIQKLIYIIYNKYSLKKKLRLSASDEEWPIYVW